MAHIIRMDQGLRLDSGLRFDQQVATPSPGRQKGKKNMAGEIIPGARPLYGDWLLNAQTQSATQGPLIGADPASVTELQGLCTAQLALIADTNAKEAAFDSARQLETDGRSATDPEISKILAAWKLLPGWTNAAGVALKAFGSGTAYDPLTYKPTARVRITGGEIRLDWTKKGAFGVHIYSRLEGQTDWTFIATDTSSPYIDGRALAQPGVAETREYMLRGINRDENEIGLESDIVSIVFAG